MITACWCFLEVFPGTTNLEGFEPPMQAVDAFANDRALAPSVLLLQFTLSVDCLRAEGYV